MRERGGRFAQEKRNDPGPGKVLNLTSLEFVSVTATNVNGTATHYNVLQHSATQ